MKRFFATVIIGIIVCACFAGCSSRPNEPAQTYTSEYSFVNPDGITVAATNPDTGMVEYKGIETIDKIQFVFEDYYVFGSSVAKITGIEVQDYGIGDARGFADVEMISVGNRKAGMKIGYTAYDKDGNVLRESYVLTRLIEDNDGNKLNEGDTAEGRRFEIPDKTTKIVFCTYTEKK